MMLLLQGWHWQMLPLCQLLGRGIMSHVGWPISWINVHIIILASNCPDAASSTWPHALTQSSQMHTKKGIYQLTRWNSLDYCWTLAAWPCLTSWSKKVQREIDSNPLVYDSLAFGLRKSGRPEGCAEQLLETVHRRFDQPCNITKMCLNVANTIYITTRANMQHLTNWCAN